MATKKFTDFDVRTIDDLSPNDYIVGYKSDGSAELRTQIKNVSTQVPYVEVTRNSTDPQQRINNTEYIFEWDTKDFETNSSVLYGNNSNYNIVLNQTGFYEIESRYSAFDLEQADYMLLNLRGSTTPITSFSNNLIELLDIRDPGVPVSLNGIATTQGRTIIRVTTVPYYLAVSYQAGNGSAEGGTAYYTVGVNTFGNLPRIRVRKINSL